MEANKTDNFEDFYNLSKNLSIEINNDQLILFKKYHKVLLDWNKKINLISRKEKNIIEKHFLDSIVFLPEIENLILNIGFPISLLDIGSGGGFPAIPLAIMKPEWHFTLCESVKKKADFLICLIKELNIEKNIKIINSRVETLQVTPPRQKFNLITARAIAKLDILLKYSLPLLKPKGFLLSYKAKDIKDEIKSSEKIIAKNNLELKIFSKEINEVERKLVVLSNSCIF